MSETQMFASPADLAEAAVTAERGHHVVAAIPPCAAGAVPILTALDRRLAAAPPGLRILILTAPDTIADWTDAACRAMPASRVLAAGNPSRSTRVIRGGQLDVLVTTPAAALQLLERSALKTDQLAAIVLAWPEAWGGAEALAVLMHDLQKDAQRVVFTAAPARAAGVIERYARKALTVGFPPAEVAPPAPVGPVRTVSVPWGRRAAAVAELAELLDAQSFSVWCVDPTGVALVTEALAGRATGANVTDGVVGASDLVIAYDPPTPERLRALLAAGPVVLLVPPSAEAYVAAITSSRRSLRLTGAVDAALDEAAKRRATIASLLDSGLPTTGLLALAPLFERYDPSAVAAALYQLAFEKPTPVAPVAAPARETVEPPAATAAGTTARMFVSVGKQDGTTASDLVAVLTKEVRIDKSMIGRIELKEAYSLVELPASEVERIVRGMDGRTVRNKKIMCKVDRGLAPAAPKRRAPTSGGSRAP